MGIGPMVTAGVADNPSGTACVGTTMFLGVRLVRFARWLKDRRQQGDRSSELTLRRADAALRRGSLRGPAMQRLKLPEAPANQTGPVKAWAEPVAIPTYPPLPPDKNPM